MLAHVSYNIEIWLYICIYSQPTKKEGKKEKKKTRKKVGWLWARNCSKAVAVKQSCRSDGGHIEAKGGCVLQPALAAGLLLGCSSSSQL